MNDIVAMKNDENQLYCCNKCELDYAQWYKVTTFDVG